MSQTKKGGRPAAAGSEWPADVNPIECAAKDFIRLFDVSPASKDLVWRVPFLKIVEEIQTVGGIAKLAGVTRKTVYRKKILLGGMMALDIVINTWRGTGRPMVTHTDPMHPLNFGQRLKTPASWFPRSVLDVVSQCKGYLENGSRVVKTTLMKPPTDTEPASPLIAKMDAKSQGRRRNWKRKSKISVSENPSWMTEDEAKENQRLERLGQTYFYRPKDRVTVKMICSRFSIPRREFYRWKAGLMVAERRLLNSAMTDKLHKHGFSGDTSAFDKYTLRGGYNEPHYEAARDEEIDKSLGWKEPKVD
jgi:hypothetical protein